jgi:hypothetical protein
VAVIGKSKGSDYVDIKWEDDGLVNYCGEKVKKKKRQRRHISYWGYHAA